MIHAILLTLAASSWADGPVKVKVNAGPVHFRESNTTKETRETITGPGGERTVTTTDKVETSELPGTTTVDTNSDTDVRGVSNPGITVERKIYLPNRPDPIVTGTGPTVTNGPGGSVIVGPEVKGGPGSVHTESHEKTTTTPNVEVQVK